MQHINPGKYLTVILIMLITFIPRQAFAQAPATVYLPLTVSTAMPVHNPGKPIVVRFTATPESITAGGSTTLSWGVTGADSVSISPGVGAVTGTSVSVHPQVTTEYTLTATNAAGSTTAKMTVTVIETPASDDGATWLPFTTGSDGVLHTRGTNVALDGQGGIHAAYAVRTGLDDGRRPAYYAFCASGCNDADQWTRVSLAVGEWVGDVRIAVDPSGHPRMLIFSTPSDDSSMNSFTYASCDSQCTHTASWTLTRIASASLIDPSRWDYVFRYFALDPQGHPAFLYTDSSQGINHNGTFYMACMSEPDACTDARNWTEVQVDPHWLGTPSLVFSPQGQPRVAVYYWDNSNELVSKLLYIECDTSCFDPVNWTAISLTNLHGSSRYSLRVDNHGRPRMTFFSGSYPDSTFQPNRLYYIWCNTQCTSPEGNDWAMHELGLSNYYGQDADLVLDAAGRPRIVYDSFGSGLGFAWCDTNCESDTAGWQHQLMEPSSKLETDYPVAPIRRCSISTWVTGQEPMLALDSEGNARVGYFAEHGYGGTDLDEPFKTCPSYTDIVLARFMQFSLP